ncbi:competence/damage-inducible protein A [Solitalea koreensis]|uniref:CinA-like protein n=1 Tax=Solitalea koreensis TaxID=543615 RepID=A0A521BBI8_9SPHI|nr:competence/damage-inducible protein A [Solitalea koreensis]SMO44455.1 nicotinamide-nucleotide amidase [Solitalea koreensis]
MFVEIITIGDEILIGQVVDTNSAWMAKKLNDIGFAVKQITSISDNKEEILKTLKEAASRADLILITGGLGPTKDDITKHTLCEYFGSKLVMNEAALENVKRIFARFNRPMIDLNVRQAEVPENCTVIQNENGTAPGMWFEHESKIYVSLPGVPFEMMAMMQNYVLPKVQDKFGQGVIVHKTLITAGLGESFLAQSIEMIEDSLPTHIKLAYLPKLGLVRLRLSAYGINKNDLQQEVDTFATQIIEKLKDHIIAEDDITIEQAILQKLMAEGKTLTTAESCTGGYIAHLLTMNPGSSKAYIGGAVTYSNELKMQLLGVKADTIAQHGAVSEETVKEMALGAQKNYNADYAIACTGIAGPDGGTPEKPVGTVWIAIAGPEKVIAKKFQFQNKRTQNIERTAVSAFYMLWNLMKDI